MPHLHNDYSVKSAGQRMIYPFYPTLKRPNAFIRSLYGYTNLITIVCNKSWNIS